jgi:hypothetical protein
MSSKKSWVKHVPFPEFKPQSHQKTTTTKKNTQNHDMFLYRRTVSEPNLVTP